MGDHLADLPIKNRAISLPEYRRIRPFGNVNHNRVVSAFGIVVVLKLLSQPPGFRANNRVNLRVERGRSLINLYTNEVLIELLPLLQKRSLHNEGQKANQLLGLPEGSARYQPL